MYLVKQKWADEGSLAPTKTFQPFPAGRHGFNTSAENVYVSQRFSTICFKKYVDRSCVLSTCVYETIDMSYVFKRFLMDTLKFLQFSEMSGWVDKFMLHPS